MTIYSFHLATPGFFATTRALLRPPTPGTVAGLQHAECMVPMQLGASIFSPGRWQVRRLAVFAAWRDETALEEFLAKTSLGRTLAQGWHVRLRFLRRWGLIRELDGLPAIAAETDLDAPVVAVTLARLKLPQAPRFIRWGKPVERLVRDHPGSTLALAAARPMRTLCTFSVWNSAREMKDMVHGRGSIPNADRHAVAMAERGRKAFHTEFTTLRFSSIGEYGVWQGRRRFVPTAAQAGLPRSGQG
ncbi:MAG: hypothetical protein ACRBN8_25680 [Nannocystales bacterium]